MHYEYKEAKMDMSLIPTIAVAAAARMAGKIRGKGIFSFLKNTI